MTERSVDPNDPKWKATMLESLLACAPMSIYFKDEEGRHTGISARMAESLVGRDYRYVGGSNIEQPEDVLGKTDLEVYGDKGQQSYIDDCSILETGQPILKRREVSNIGPITEWRSTTKRPLRDGSGEIIGLVGVTSDRFEEMRSEQLEKFTRTVSDDLQRPLEEARNGIEAELRDRDCEYLESALTAIDRMDSLIEDMLILAHEGNQIDDLEPVDAAAVVEDAWNRVETAEAVLQSGWNGHLLADRTRLQQLFENLFRNAIEHGGEKVSVTVGPLEDGTGFFVEDDGPGIPESERERVFEWGHTTASGTGLGLAIVSEITEGHRWDVRATESDDGGARFEFTRVAFESD